MSTTKLVYVKGVFYGLGGEGGGVLLPLFEYMSAAEGWKS